jgi:hypothetical protein
VKNPIEGIDPAKLNEMEALVDSYYNLAKESDTLNIPNLHAFQDFDLESNDITGYDIKELLKLN